MAITLTAAQGGLIETQGAAAVVIGANIGTTVTALLAAIGTLARVVEVDELGRRLSVLEATHAKA
jgi:Na+/phosphate symporter